MSVLKYKDPVTGEVKSVGAPSADGLAREETLQEILALLNNSCMSAVKRVQTLKIKDVSLSEQTTNNSALTDTKYYKDYTISEVDVNKTVFSCMSEGANASTFCYEPLVELIDSTTLRVYTNYLYNGVRYIRNLQIQIIEYA